MRITRVNIQARGGGSVVLQWSVNPYTELSFIYSPLYDLCLQAISIQRMDYSVLTVDLEEDEDYIPTYGP